MAVRTLRTGSGSKANVLFETVRVQRNILLTARFIVPPIRTGQLFRPIVDCLSPGRVGGFVLGLEVVLPSVSVAVMVEPDSVQPLVPPAISTLIVAGAACVSAVEYDLVTVVGPASDTEDG